jgi:hypothetical protein
MLFFYICVAVMLIVAVFTLKEKLKGGIYSINKMSFFFYKCPIIYREKN